MALRVSFNNQMYKVPKLPTDLKAVTDVVNFLFGAEIQQGWILEYLDPKDGPVALSDEEAYKQLQKMMWSSKKPVKLNVRFAGDLEQNNQRRSERSVPMSTNLEERRETQSSINDANSTQATQSKQYISGDEQEEACENEEQTVIESDDIKEDSVTISRNKRKDKHRDLKDIKATLQKTLDKTKEQGVQGQGQSESAPMLTVALQLRKPKRNPGSSSGKSSSTGQNSKQIIKEIHLQQKNIKNIIGEEEDIEDEDESYANNTTAAADQKAKPLNQIYDAEIEEKVIRLYDIFSDADLKDLRRFVTPIHYLPIETLIERFLTS